jgi:hypothetical protein
VCVCVVVRHAFGCSTTSCLACFCPLGVLPYALLGHFGAGPGGLMMISFLMDYCIRASQCVCPRDREALTTATEREGGKTYSQKG